MAITRNTRLKKLMTDGLYRKIRSFPTIIKLFGFLKKLFQKKKKHLETYCCNITALKFE